MLIDMISAKDFADKIENLFKILPLYFHKARTEESKLFDDSYYYINTMEGKEVKFYGLDDLQVFLLTYRTFGHFVCSSDTILSLVNHYKNATTTYSLNKDKFFPKENIKKDLPVVKAGTEWIHNNLKQLYRVLFLANTETQNPIKYPVVVVYQGYNGNIWTRPLHDWHRSMTSIDMIENFDRGIYDNQ